MFLLWFGFDLLDLESKLAGNGLELMAKDMRTQPTSQHSGPTSQNLAFGQFVFGFVCISLVLIPGTKGVLNPQKQFCIFEKGLPWYLIEARLQPAEAQQQQQQQRQAKKRQVDQSTMAALQVQHANQMFARGCHFQFNATQYDTIQWAITEQYNSNTLKQNSTMQYIQYNTMPYHKVLYGIVLYCMCCMQRVVLLYCIWLYCIV